MKLIDKWSSKWIFHVLDVLISHNIVYCMNILIFNFIKNAFVSLIFDVDLGFTLSSIMLNV